MERQLIFIKHKLGFMWRIIEECNAIIFFMLYHSKLEKLLPVVFNEMITSPFLYRVLNHADCEELYDLLHRQDDSDLKFFHPHDFDMKSLARQVRNKAFLMMGAFNDGQLVGYFFLRFFVNRKCFVGRLIDKPMRGKGMGQVMNGIMYETAWRLGFRCLSTISCNNTAVMRAHQKNQRMIVLKELNNEYLLVEFVR